METTLKALAFTINLIHDLIFEVLEVFGYKMSDKDLHFWIIGFTGLVIFMITDNLFRQVSKLSISIISFIYTFTVLVVIVFALEIQQKITGRGNMEFADITAGLWGFIFVFGAYLLLKAAFYYIRKLLKKR